MNVSTIVMDPKEAQRKLKEYRGRKHRSVDEEYQRAEVAYAALARGTPLLVLSEAIEGAPRDHKGRPRLAIARADRDQVELRWDGDRRVVYDASNNRMRDDTIERLYPELAIGVGLTTPRVAEGSLWSARGFAMVPLVPPAVLGNRARSSHFILWEVEAWADSRIGAQPDRDPYLLKHIEGELYAVVGEWDLTDVERAIMRARGR